MSWLTKRVKDELKFIWDDIKGMPFIYGVTSIPLILYVIYLVYRLVSFGLTLF